jgi:hypothetical protein
VILSFSTKKLRDSCQRLDLADEAFGAKQAQALFRLLAEVEAAGTADDLLALYAQEARFEEDSILITFAPQCSASFDAVLGKSTLGSVSGDWSVVRRLKLTLVEIGPDA